MLVSRLTSSQLSCLLHQRIMSILYLSKPSSDGHSPARSHTQNKRNRPLLLCDNGLLPISYRFTVNKRPRKQVNCSVGMTRYDSTGAAAMRRILRRAGVPLLSD